MVAAAGYIGVVMERSFLEAIEKSWTPGLLFFNTPASLISSGFNVTTIWTASGLDMDWLDRNAVKGRWTRSPVTPGL